MKECLAVINFRVVSKCNLIRGGNQDSKLRAPRSSNACCRHPPVYDTRGCSVLPSIPALVLRYASPDVAADTSTAGGNLICGTCPPVAARARGAAVRSTALSAPEGVDVVDVCPRTFLPMNEMPGRLCETQSAACAASASSAPFRATSARGRAGHTSARDVPRLPIARARRAV